MIEKNYKEDFPLLQTNKTIYIDNAATAQKPAVVIEAEKRFYEENNANPLRGFYYNCRLLSAEPCSNRSI